MRFDGKLKSWNDERGFGFIEPVQGGQEVFVHIKSFPPGTGRPAVGLALTFEVDLGPQGKKRAKSVQFRPAKRQLHVDQPFRHPSVRRPEPPAAWTLPRLFAVPGFVVVYVAVASRWPVAPWVAAAYLAVSLFTFFAYAVDKSAARAGRWRTTESTLHAYALLCGWPGALLAQQLLRHKLSKPSFVSTFWSTVAVNIALFVAVHSPAAQRLLR